MSSNILSKSAVCLHKRWLPGCMPAIMPLTSVSKTIRCFSDRTNDDATPESNTPYIPRRIRKRLESRNLSVEDVGQKMHVPHHTDAIYSSKDVDRGMFKRLSSADEFKKALNEAKVGDFKAPDFPSEYKRSDMQMQVRKAYRERIDPKETTVLLFPGQGSQFVGMGKNILQYPGVPDLYEKASNILGYDLLHMCLYGPEKELMKTIYCQPAVLVTSLAAMEKLKEQHPTVMERCVGTAGFSVGEFAALVVAGALQFEDAVKLIKQRAESMEESAQAIPGGMMTVFISHQSQLLKAMEAAREYCSSRCGIEYPVCSVANFLCTDCKVLAGNIEALKFIEQYKRHFKLLRTKWLPVSGAFHTSLMRPEATHNFKRMLNTIEIQDPKISVHSNLDGKIYKSAYDIQLRLPSLISKAVAWEQTIHRIYQRPAELEIPQTYGVGPGVGQLGMLLKLTNARAHKEYQQINV